MPGPSTTIRSGRTDKASRAATMPGTSRKLRRSGMKGNFVWYSRTWRSRTARSGKLRAETAMVMVSLKRLWAIATPAMTRISSRASVVTTAACSSAWTCWAS
ncbi:hypothetical protein D3C72_2280540 [compost metagenome]